jgi:hypothetical protein
MLSLAVAAGLLQRHFFKSRFAGNGTISTKPLFCLRTMRMLRMPAQRGDMAILPFKQYFDFARAGEPVTSRGQVVKQDAGAGMDRDNIRNFVAL